MKSLLIAKNIIKRTFKSKKEMIIMLVLPIAAIGLMTFVNGSKAQEKIHLGIINKDSGEYSSKLISSIETNSNIDIKQLNIDEYKDALKEGKITAAIELPVTFSQDVEKDIKTDVKFYTNGSDVSTEKLKQDINQYISKLYVINATANSISKEANKNKETLKSYLLSSTNNGLLTSNFKLGSNSDDNVKRTLLSSIGFSIMFIMVLIFNTLGVIVEDKKKLTLARIATFKVRSWEIIVGNLLGSLALGFIQLVPIVIVLSKVYKLSIFSEAIPIFLILLSLVIASIGLAIVISNFIKDLSNPAIVVAAVIFPTCLLGGCLIPESMMPSVMTKIGYAVPQKWAMHAIQKVMTGASIQDILLNLAVILLFGVILCMFGVKRLKPLD